MNATDYEVATAAAVRIRRIANDEIAEVGVIFQEPIADQYEFVCECGDLGCKAPVRMTLAEYAESTPGSVVGHD